MVVLDASLLNIQPPCLTDQEQVEQSKERGSAIRYTSVY